MSENSAIEWTDHTFNAWEGCTKVSPGCDHCYAEARNIRFHQGAHWGPGAPRLIRGIAYWREPLKWNARHEAFAAKHGRRQRVFCSSLADVFDNEAPTGQRERLWRLIAETPYLDWLLVTKRIGNARSMLPADWSYGYPNVWIGATVVNQEEVERDVKKLLATPARIRFLSMEPLLDDTDLSPYLWGVDHPCAQCPQDIDCECGWKTRRRNGLPALDWVIVGGESGPHARPMALGWAKEIVRQCSAADVAVFVKQLGAQPTNREGQRCPHIKHPKGAAMDEWPEELQVRQFPTQKPPQGVDHAHSHQATA